MVEPRERVMYFNGRIMPHSEGGAELQAKDAQSAGGVYDTQRTFNGQVFKLRHHLERLYSGLKHEQIDPGLSLGEMETATLELLEANRPLLGNDDEFTITQVVSRTQAADSDGAAGVNVSMYCQFLDFSAFAKGYVNGVRLVTPVTYGVPRQDTQDGSEGGGQKVIPFVD